MLPVWRPSSKISPFDTDTYKKRTNEFIVDRRIKGGRPGNNEGEFVRGRNTYKGGEIFEK